jgi:hypothetical protein|tara:strand:+ start:704 stop:1123 length:420 start_codon:yes stop_codon:yes gene_type:complete
MTFKLGTGKSPFADKGELKAKFRFNKESGDADVSVPGTPVLRKNLEGGVMGEANNDGSIYLNSKVEPGSFEERQVLMHEMIHMKDMKLGKLEYGDNHIKWNGETFPRKTIKGKDMLLYEGEWVEAGHTGFPWEQMPWGQ